MKIKLIKFYTWEDVYRKKINQMRKIEIETMQKELGLKIASLTIVFTAPVISTSISIAVCRATHQELTAQLVFTLLFLFNTLRHPLMLLPNAKRTIDGATNAFKRLDDFFGLPEVDKPPISVFDSDQTVCMKITDAGFVWDGDLGHPHLTNLNLILKRGELIAVVGDSTGKSLLAAIMGQIKKVSGDIATNGIVTCGFIPQEPWLIKASLRDNIIFGIEIDDKNQEQINAAYSDAIRISGLTRDFLLLSNGDETFVNELNLSQAQKQRFIRNLITGFLLQDV